MTQTLTALERELLASVERLVTACESSAKELHALEKRSTSRIESKVNGLAHCVALLMKSHLTSVTTLADLLREEPELRDAAGGVRDQLETSERRREAAERELDARKLNRKLTH